MTSENHFDEFQTFFPEGTVIIDVKGTIDCFESSLRSTSKNKDDFKLWLKNFEEKSKLTFRVQKTKLTTGTTVLYKAAYRCHHNTYPKSHLRVRAAHPKHTECPAVLRVTIKSPVDNRRVRSADKLRAKFPTIITYSHSHNHRDDVAVVFRPTDSNLLDSNFINSFDIDEQTEEITLASKESETTKLNWPDLKTRWITLFEKFENTNSTSQYAAIGNALTNLENCLTERAVVFALHDVSKSFWSRKYGTSILMQPTSVARSKVKRGIRERVQNGRSLKSCRRDHTYDRPQGLRRER